MGTSSDPTNATIASGQQYFWTGTVGTSANDGQLLFQLRNSKFNLNGQTLHGYVALNGDLNAAEIYNGTIQCQVIGQKTITTVSRTSNVATVNFASAHNILTQSDLQITGVTGASGFNTSNARVTVATSTSITYANTGVDVGTTTADAGSGATVSAAFGGGQSGCIIQTNGSANPTTTNQIHDMVVRNLSTADQANNVRVDWSTASNGTVPYWTISYNDFQSPPGGVSRVANVFAQGNSARTWKQFDAFNNKITFLATSYGQQGIAMFNCAYCEAHENYGIGATVNAGLDSGRFFLADANSTPGSNNAKVWQNYTTGTSNNRGMRVRNSQNVQITYNRFLGVETANSLEGNCFHLGDPDSGDTDLQSLNISNNFCGIKGAGVGGWLRNAYSTTTMTINNNTFLCDVAGCASAKTWYLRQALTGGRSEFTCMKNDTYTTITANNVYDKGSSVAPVWNYASITAPTFSGTGTVNLAANAGCP